jgi:mitogen-activated protein kinase kinase 5
MGQDGATASDGYGAVDWTVPNANLLTFSAGMEVISQIMPNTTVTAFEYEDEDGDRITVRSDDEMNAMLSFYESIIQSVGQGNDSIPPLVIYPKVGKTPAKRNKFDLKVKIKESDSVTSNTATSQVEPMEQDCSRKRSGDIREILACGTIHDSDLTYVKELGSGNCGTVYKAMHKLTGNIMAVKVIPLDITKDAQQQIISELEVLYRCHSPVIISFFGAFFLENRISICTEFMDGGSLDQYKFVPENVLGPISVSVVQGLQYLWSLKIMHRDVKPSNILVNTQGQVKLCDFGVSVQLLDSVAKTFIGTNAYMAPERIKGQQYSIHSEVWSLGVSLFELAAGYFPYQSAKTAGSKCIDLWKSIVDKEPPILPRDRFSAEFVHFVSQCMQKAPLHRPAPEALMRHPFIQKYIDCDSVTVAEWVRDRLVKQLAAQMLPNC